LKCLKKVSSKIDLIIWVDKVKCLFKINE
jgi:hypothetical protein